MAGSNSFMGQNSSLSEIVQWCKCFPHMSKILTLAYNMASNVIIQNNIILNIINIKVVMCIILVLQKRPDGLNHIIWWVPPVEQELGLSFQRIWVHIQFQVGFVLDMSSNYLYMVEILCCDVSCDCRVIIMFGLSLFLFVL